MTVRRINYSGRIKLNRDEANVVLWPPPREGEAARFEVNLDLSRLLPHCKDARVFAEAYHRSVRIRFDYGTVAHPLAPSYEMRKLDEFPVWKDVLFRVKISDEGSGRIVAWADRIKPQGLDESNESDLLRFRDAELSGKVWHIEYDEQGPIVLIEKELGGVYAIARTDSFRSLVYPEILRRVLIHALVEEEMSIEDEDQWFNAWFDGFLRDKLLLEPPTEFEHVRDIMPWIDKAVDSFCNRFQIASHWTNTEEVEK